MARLEEAAKHPKVVAIGECGLDYHYEGYNKDAQIDAFYRQLHLAERLNLPVIVHSRDATQDTMNILREEHARRPLTAVMHCFSGETETARELIKMGILLSFTGVLTFKNARKALEVVREIPLDMLMLETDCPYMAPEPFRGKLCDSSMTWKTAEKIAEIKGVITEKVVEVCNNNARKFFNIDF
jgi:TatD DNase family protein